MSNTAVFKFTLLQLACLLLMQPIAASAQQQNSIIDIEIDNGFNPQSLSILLDNQDISEFAVTTTGGIRIDTGQLMQSGKHTLLVSYLSAEGYRIRKLIELDQASQSSFYDGTLKLGITLRGKLQDKNDINAQDYETDTYLGHQGYWQNASWSGNVNADLWLFDRGTDIDPLKNNHAELINYYASAQHKNDNNNMLAEVGYIQLNESQNTIDQLARRGAHANYQGESLSLDLFTVNSQQQLGSGGSAGFGDGSDNNIIGISSGWTAIASAEQTLNLRAIYSKGAQNGDSLGILGASQPSEGEVSAVLLQSTHHNLGLNVEAEFDQSSFDANSSDSLAAKDDKAYGLRVKGNGDWIDYSAAYEYIGTNYAVVANPLLQNDREYIVMAASMGRGEHAFTLRAQQEHDNLDDESTRARLITSYLNAEYLYRKGRNFSTVISLQNNQLKSENEPAASDIRDSSTDSVLAKLSFVTGQWNHLLSYLVSELDDNTTSNNDSRITSATLATSLYTGPVMFTPSYTSTETSYNSGQKTTQSILSLYLLGKTFKDRLGYQLSGSYSDSRDNSGPDTRSTYVVASTDWSLGRINVMSAHMQHSIGLELEWYDSENDGSTIQDDSLAWLTYKLVVANQP